MTAAEYDGVAVVDDQPTASHLRDRAGGVVYHTQTRTLTLADGRTVYGCAHCDYTHISQNGIRPHLSRHNNKRRNGHTAPAAELSLNQLMQQIGALGELTDDRDAWRTRALAAEKRLRQLRAALGVTA